jgi:CHASE3 domain sensor protein
MQESGFATMTAGRKVVIGFVLVVFVFAAVGLMAYMSLSNARQAALEMQAGLQTELESVGYMEEAERMRVAVRELEMRLPEMTAEVIAHLEKGALTTLMMTLVGVILSLLMGFLIARTVQAAITALEDRRR